jgi:ABC-2 type transport system permease protein
VNQALTEIWVLLVPKLRGLTRMFRSGEERHPLRLLVFGALGLAFAYGIYAGSAWFLRHVMEVELIGQLIPRKLMSLVMLILLSILLISTTISAFSIFFLSDDLQLLMSAPVPVGPLYFARLAEMVVHSSWMVLFFGLPVFLAFGTSFGAPWIYYLAVGLLFPALILIPGALGAIIAVVLTRLFSARRSRDLLVVLVVLGFVSVYLLIRTMRPERLLDEAGFGTMMEFLDMFRTPESRYLPTQWMTEFLFPLLQGRASPGWLPALGVWSTAGGLCALSGWIGTALYLDAYDRAQVGRVRHSAFRAGGQRLLGPWLDRLVRPSGRLTGPLLVKDIRVFLRDTNQWLQLLLLGALAAVYVLNFSYLKLAEFSWFTLYTINHAMVGLVLAGVAVRFVFPAVSLEGRAWWVVRSAPVELKDFLHSKLLIHFAPLAGLGVFLSVLSCVVIGAPLAFAVGSVALVSTAALCISAIGVGIGAVYPKFEAENPAKIPTGVGGVAFMISSMTFVLVFLLTSVYPTFVLYHWPQRLQDPIGRPTWFFGSLAALVVLAVLGSWLPMWLGNRALSRRED